MSNGTNRTLPVGAWVSLEKPRLQDLIDLLQQAGYRTVGPRVADAAIVYDELDSVSQLPLGVLDEQDGGRYRLNHDAAAGYFDHVVGPHSLKNYVFPPRETLQELVRANGSWQKQPPPDPGPPIAVIGVLNSAVSLYYYAKPLREMFPAVDLRSPSGPAAATIVVLACFVAAVAVYLAALRFS